MPSSADLAITPRRDSRPRAKDRILVAGLARTVDQWVRRARTRRELKRLDARLLADIGVTHADARREAAKPFWKA